MNKLIAWLDDAAATDCRQYGPKAATQAMLGLAGLPIQQGFCLSAEAYRLQLKSLGLDQLAESAAALELAGADARQQVSKIRIGLFEEPITAEVQEPLLQAWRQLSDAGAEPIVVRSSALMEDTAGSTFAGQFETFLDLDGEDEFLTAIRACWAAMWSSRVLKYMATHKVDPMESAMGLCIQRLVKAKVSGGGMSQLANGNMLISATWGLGTSIAQGEVVPDRYELSRDAELIEIENGRIEHIAHCSHGAAAPKPRADLNLTADKSCLDEQQVVQIAKIMRRAEQIIGNPVEIEWALDDGGFRMLQARPLTTEPAHILEEEWSNRPGLKGQPSGTGWATGRSCVVSCECELSRVAPGDVLVTKIAGPALSEVLSRVSAVVAELGGSTSHLASLARERGIPMVLGVLEATRKIPEGVSIGVDGATGMVRWQAAPTHRGMSSESI